MVRPEELQKYLEENIPLSKAMGVNVDAISDKTLILKAPLLENINHKNTVFGGSLHAVATLACWGMVYAKLQPLERCPEIVITRSSTSYLKPVTKDFTASCESPLEADWQKFLKTFQRYKKGRLDLKAHIFEGGQLCLKYQATFAILG